MPYYIQQDKCTIIKRHIFLLLFGILKFVFFLSVSCVMFYILFSFEEKMEYRPFAWMLFVTGILLLHYGVFRLISSLIEYYNKLIIIHKDKIIILNATFILQDDIEILDSRKIIKIDKYAHGFIPNLFGYGQIMIEQQNNDVRCFNFVPNPSAFLQVCNAQRDAISAKKQGVVTEK